VLAVGSFINHSLLTILDFEGPSGITHLLDWSFSGCFSMCAELGKSVFESLAAVQGPESHAFCDCRCLTYFTVPSSLSTLANRALFGYTKLSYVTFDTPSHLGNIPDFLFGFCSCLRTLALPDSVTEIARSAFQLSGVTSIIGSDWTLLW
jgi:hypothetical protein